MTFDLSSTKNRIFAAAISVFAAKGFKGATVRDICTLAGSSNTNAVNYYFGSKLELYKLILEFMFAAFGERMDEMGSTDSSRDPEERLCEMIRSNCAMLFSHGESGDEILAIFNAEMAQPSPFLNELIDKHLIGQHRTILKVMADLMGRDCPEWLLRDCGVSVFSQIMYYSSTWPIFSRVNPDHSGMGDYYEHLAEHVCRFSLAGIREMKRAYHAGELTSPE